MARVNRNCGICMEQVGVLTMVLGDRYPEDVPLCLSCAKDAVKNLGDWNHYVEKTEE